MSIHKRKAIVCKNGHVAKSALKLNEDYSESYCVICGSELLFRCSSCGNFIDGAPYYDNVVTLGFDFNPPKIVINVENRFRGNVSCIILKE